MILLINRTRNISYSVSIIYDGRESMDIKNLILIVTMNKKFIFEMIFCLVPPCNALLLTGP